MATGRIGVTPTLGTRWSKAPAGGTTSLSGLDDNSVALVYSVGYEQVYRNGVLLSRGNDYTATTGNSITLIDATIAGDIIEVFANELVPLTDAISKGQFTAKGALLSATAASTPGVLAVGTNGQYLQADSTASTGLKWADVSAGANWSLLNAGGTALTGAATITVSGISGKDKLMVIIQGASNATTNSSIFSIRFNADSGNNYYQWGGFRTWTTTGEWQLPDSGTRSSFNITNNGNIDQQTTGYILLSGGNSSGVKQVQYFGLPNWQGYNAGESYQGIGYYNSSSTISSVSLLSSAGNFDAGTLYVYASA